MEEEMSNAGPGRFTFALIADDRRRAMAVASKAILGPAPIIAALERALVGVAGAHVGPSGPNMVEMEATDTGSIYKPVTLGIVAFDTEQSWDSLRALAAKIA